MKDPYRPRLCDRSEKEPWEKLIDIARDKGPEWILSEIIDNPKIEWDNQEKSVSSESKRIKTLDQLLEVADVDLSIYEVEKHVANSWEVTSWKRGFPETRTNHQVKAWLRNKWFDKVDSEEINRIIGNKSHLLPKYSPSKTPKGKPISAVIADLHCGAWIKDMKLVPDYNVSVLEEKLSRLSYFLNDIGRPVSLKIMGDLIESFTGKNHKDTWLQIEQHGMRVMFTVGDLIIKFLNNTPCVYELIILSGNHDRVSSANDEDTEGQVAYAVSELIKRSGFDNVKYDPVIISNKVDGFTEILTHGHLPLSKKKPSDLVLDYGDQNTYNILIKAHKHFESVEEVTTKVRVQQCPSFVPANNFAERLGAHAPTGFLIIESNDFGSVDVRSVAN